MKPTTKAAWTKKDLLGLEELSTGEIELLLDRAAEMKKDFLDNKQRDDLKGQTLAFVFTEPSTRTRSSFEVAARRLGADALGFSVANSSVLKGETLSDTLSNLEAMGVRYFVIRHELSGAVHQAAAATRAHILNAGDGAHEHPTQALLDIYTLREKKGRISGLRVVIVGDILHSRVARSNIWGLLKLKAKVTVCGPATLIPRGIEKSGVSVSHDLVRALKDADAVNVLRLQQERMKGNYIPSLSEYYETYGLTDDKLALAREDCIVLHPGPMNRGVEISSSVAEGPRSVILEQVTNGVAVRMAALSLLSKAGGEQ
ncbi:MAG: aspartate carbamoyltransferase catalytic subunit [Proteobacteria bacterium]|nr:aspartate carbamoyltransferase catalytic subunit [Pseudomonadota bacterium]